MVNVGGEKMSKSLGNFTTIRALLESGVSPMTLRLFVLQAHYRKPLDFTAEALAAAASGWKGLNAALDLAAGAADPAATAAVAQADGELGGFRERFGAALDDDLNTSAALAVLFELARPLRAQAHRQQRGDAAVADAARELDLRARGALLLELAGVLGLIPETLPKGGSATPGQAEEPDVEAAIAARRQAKAERDFATADRIRDELRARGIELIDRPGGVTDWIRA